MRRIFRRWWARHRIKTAARLLRKGVFTEREYGLFTLHYGYALFEQPLTEGTIIDEQDFFERFGRALGIGTKYDHTAFNALLSTYGPWDKAFTSIRASLNQSGSPPQWAWTQSLAQSVESQAVRFNSANRAALAWEEWWHRQGKLFPSVSNVVLWLIGIIMGWFGHVLVSGR